MHYKYGKYFRSSFLQKIYLFVANQIYRCNSFDMHIVATSWMNLSANRFGLIFQSQPFLTTVHPWVLFLKQMLTFKIMSNSWNHPFSKTKNNREVLNMWRGGKHIKFLALIWHTEYSYIYPRKSCKILVANKTHKCH